MDPSEPTPAKPRPEVDLQATGYFKALPTSSRVAGLWSQLGLLIGDRLALVIRDDHVFLILMAAVVGVTSGAAAGALLAWIGYAFELFPRDEGGDPLLRWAVVVGVPVLGGLLAGGLHLLLRRVIRQPTVLGIPAVIEAIARGGGRIGGRQAVVVGVGTGITIGSGGSCGHEGPSVAIGAAVGSVLARFFGLRMRWHLSMVGAGCAGGLAAAFNAPLAGVIFTVEIVFGGAIGGNVGTMSVFVPLIVAAVAGTLTSHAIRGEHLTFHAVQHGDGMLAEMLFFVALAAIAGVVGTAFGRAMIVTTRWFDQLRAPLWVKPAIGALGVGLLAALVSNELLGAGHSTLARALDGSLGWKLALTLGGLKLVTTAMTVGSGGFGGVFMPSLYVGACLGTVVAVIAEAALGPGVESAGVYALVGMGAIFAATMHAPLTPIVMIFELTQDYAVILPLMLGCILAVFVARRTYPLSFFKDTLRSRGVILGHEAEVEVMKRGHVADLMLPAPAVLASAADLETIRKASLEADMRATFVVDDGGAVIGFINGNQLARRMLTGELHAGSTAIDVMGTAGLPYLYTSDTLAGAMLASARSGMEVLPVVDDERHLLGVLRRGDLLAHYSDKVLGEQEEAVHLHGEGAPGHEVGLGKGIILEHLVVSRRWAGRSLAALDLRGETGVTVLEWLRGDAVLPVDPNAALREGDVLAAVGTREQFLKARRLR
ncbi:chloride channel protein [Nannocystis sp.]|uniref:chloride channel protein n=1 Tax=Nannocystis sp. TaxID=1962667 RepID=UPI0025E28123|nr:chloride channel protein [Nannocystis sp.]MBK7826647.1 chloride channel protein [Nannocystis sp.]